VEDCGQRHKAESNPQPSLHKSPSLSGLLYLYETMFRERKSHQVFSPDHIAVELMLDLADYLFADVWPVDPG
jgi:hypothetical protein